MSTTRLVFGSSATKSRSRWLRTGPDAPLIAYWRQRRFCGTPNRPAPVISRAMRLRLAVSPS